MEGLREPELLLLLEALRELLFGVLGLPVEGERAEDFMSTGFGFTKWAFISFSIG